MASRGVNKVIIMGNLGKDPEVKFMPSGGAVANFVVATSETWKDKQTGEQKENTEWHKIVMYQRLAEIAGEYLRKGSKVYLEGRLQTRKWVNQQGVDQYTTEIVANEMQMLDGRPQGQGAPMGQSDSMGGGYNSPQGGYNQSPQQSAPTGGYNQPAQPAQGGYNQPAQPAQGGYNPAQQRPAAGGYNQPAAAPQTGGFAPPPQQQGGFKPAPQSSGGYTPPQQGGFAPPPQQGGFAPPPQQGGFAKPAPAAGGFNKPQQAPVEPPIDFDDDIPF